MTFLPIVEREMRVAARHQFTYWSRPVAAAVPLVIFGVVLAFLTLAQMGGGGISPGRVEFTILSWMAFIFAGCAGVFLTSDSLSEEKRDGTLGLLFLTDLRGYDVVLGKLMSHSLLAFYALVAAFPVLALPLMMGGVTGGLFGMSLLVICNTLFLSLAVGIFVSSISREVMKAMTLTLVLILFIVGGLPWLDFALADWDASKFQPILSVASPGHLFAVVENLRPRDFWFQVGIQHALAWGFLGLACVCVPRAWKEKTSSTSGWRQKFAAWWGFGGKGARLAFRRKLLERNPILWLAARDRGLTRLIWVALLMAPALVGWPLLVNQNVVWHQIFSSIQQLLNLVLLLWIAMQASRFFVDAGRNGAMELILVTPVTPGRIVRGQWAALWKIFLIPVLFVLALHVTSSIGMLRGFQKSMIAANAAAKTASTYDMVPQIVGLITGTVELCFSYAGLAWFGMWMGVTSKKTSIAVLKSICFVCVIPWLIEGMAQVGVILIGSRIFNGLGGSSQWPFSYVPIFLMFLLDMAKNLFFIFWSRHKLLTTLRETAALGNQAKIRRLTARVASVATVAVPDNP